MFVFSIVRGGVIINLSTPFFPSWFTIYVHLPIMRWLELNQIRFNLQLNCEVLFSPKWGCKTNIKLKLLCNFFLFLHSFFKITTTKLQYFTTARQGISLSIVNTGIWFLTIWKLHQLDWNYLNTIFRWRVRTDLMLFIIK